MNFNWDEETEEKQFLRNILKQKKKINLNKITRGFGRKKQERKKLISFVRFTKKRDSFGDNSSEK